MGTTVHDRLRSAGVLAVVVLPHEVEVLLRGLELTAPPPAATTGTADGRVKLVSDLHQSPVPGFDFALALPTPSTEVPYRLTLEGQSFTFWFGLGGEEHLAPYFDFVKDIPGFEFTGAEKVTGPDGTVGLRALPSTNPKARPRLMFSAGSAGQVFSPSLRIRGDATHPAEIRFTPSADSTDGVVTARLDPPTVVLGTSGTGFDLVAGLTLDDSDTAVPPGGPGVPGLQPAVAQIGPDQAGWRGFVCRRLDFYLPAGVPLFGGRPAQGYLAIPRGPGGAQLVVSSDVPAKSTAPTRPGYRIRIECLDPTATGFSGLVPTLISASMDLDLAGPHGGITFAAGAPVRATATLARDPLNAPGELRVVVGVNAQGDGGVVSVDANGGPGRVFTSAAAVASALIADKDVARQAKVGDGTGVVLPVLLAAGAALSSLFKDKGRFVLHGVEIESTGHGAPVGDNLVLTLDYSVDVRVVDLGVGVLSVTMRDDQPMRIRVRQVRMSLDLRRSGLDMIGLDFDRCSMEVESPGAWSVRGLESLFDVLRSRSGRGSTWMEVDLGFKVDLGPIKVSGATLRAELKQDLGIDVSLRGLAAGLEIPGVLEGEGGVRVIKNPDGTGGFAADLAARIEPLNLGVHAGVVYAPPMVLLQVDVDLPAPIPLANSGLGLMGIGGLVGFSARPNYESVPEPDPIIRQLRWNPADPASFVAAPGQQTFGLSAAVGTLPDLGFTFSAKAALLITAPDIAVRGSLNGRVMQPAAKLTDPSYPPPAGISYLGMVGIDEHELVFALIGSMDFRPLIEVKVPIAGRFPLDSGADDWWVYLGADGRPDTGAGRPEGRQIGRISARVLPDFIDAAADAYFMARGRGITQWPYGGSKQITVPDGPVVAFGFHLQTSFGVKPIYAELHAGLELLLGTRPLTLAGFGSAGGSLHLGPFSLGVEAKVSFMAAAGQNYLWAEVTGRIELFFFDIEGTVTISFGSEPKLKLPQPERHPLDEVDQHGTIVGSLGRLSDDSYRVVAPLAETPAAAKAVWPDTVIVLPFAVAPEIAPGAGSQFPAAEGAGAPPPPARLGVEMLHFSWRLDDVRLADVTDEDDQLTGAGTAPTGELASQWQVARSGPGGSDVAELVLLSTGPDLWVNRLADGGAKLPRGNPLKHSAHICDPWPALPERAWAIGWLASRRRPGWWLPAETVSADPRVCRVEAAMHHLGLLPSGPLRAMPLDDVHSLPEPYRLEPAAFLRYPEPNDPVPLDPEHPFLGHVVTPTLFGRNDPMQSLAFRAGTFVGQRTDLELADGLLDGVLVLRVDQQVVDDADVAVRFRVSDEFDQTWDPEGPAYLSDGGTVYVCRAPHGDPVRTISVQMPLNARLGVLGVGGITQDALRRVQRERTARQDEAKRRRKAAGTPPPTTAQGVGPHVRSILEPGRLYRVDVVMSWSGLLSKQTDDGAVVPVDEVLPGAGTTYAGNRSTTKRLFFRTAPPAALPPAIGTPGYLPWLQLTQDQFDPAMLQRYLAGYEPAQSEQFRFRDDPLKAHFSADHVAALADSYGLRFDVALRRVDKAGPEHARPQKLLPIWTAGTNPAFLSPADRMRRQFALDSPCDVPLPGATATAAKHLDPLAWYEAFVRVSPVGGDSFSDLPGVTFRTSRWRTPADMLTGLGLAAGGAAPGTVVSGDLELPPGAAVPPAGDDQGFENMLAAMTLDGWPVAAEPRLSRLWTRDPNTGAWLFAGLMLESPEPISRPGRFDGITLSARTTGPFSLPFPLHASDRLGARLLFLTATPLAVAGALDLHIGPVDAEAMQRRLTLTGTVPESPESVTGTLTLPAAIPSFAVEEAS